MKNFMLWIFACGMVPVSVMAQAAPKFVIETRNRVGFSKASEFYTLGTKLEEFRAKLGAAEKSEKDNDTEGYLAQTVSDYHVNDGFVVTAKDGTVIGVIFDPVPSSNLKAASVATDRGIKAGSSEKEVIKQYGEPYAREEYKQDQTLGLYYKLGEVALSFRWDKGELKAIGLNAGYLKYLEKFRKK
jgi:hypothetical protein